MLHGIYMTCTPIYSTPAAVFSACGALCMTTRRLRGHAHENEVFLHKLSCMSHVLVPVTLTPYTELAQRKTVTAADVGGSLSSTNQADCTLPTRAVRRWHPGPLFSVSASFVLMLKDS